MALICIFHDRAELRHARAIDKLVAAAGFVPWLADSDSIGNWRDDVVAALARPDCVGAIVIWSENSIKNAIVVGESEVALRTNRKLLGVVLNDVRPPIGLENTPRVLVKNWDGSEDYSGLDALRTKIAHMATPVGESVRRISEVVVDGRTLACPAFVFSVSSFETQISPARTLELLNLFTPPAVLVSAYDVLGMRDASPDVTPTSEVFRELEGKDAAIFLDSGNYEAYRLEDEWWQRSPWLLKEAASRVRCDVIFSHDRIISVRSAREKKPTDLAQQVINDAERDANATGRRTISPIVHAPRLEDGTFASAMLPELCALVAKKRRPPLIAIAERELGDGIIARARRVRSIRRALDRLDIRQPLHLLGTGNPLSMMILALAGGDVFDGLEWCRTVVDGNTMRLHHFHHFDLFVAQRSQIRDELIREYLTTQDELLTAKAKAVLHNLYFFRQFATELQQAHRQDSFEVLFERYLPVSTDASSSASKWQMITDGKRLSD
jgi:queuine/archaeosine tRNA-ribosyltransferase